jgi:DeoR/GlpR family transcriptional regulator of sugar metabolism
MSRKTVNVRAISCNTKTLSNVWQGNIHGVGSSLRGSRVARNKRWFRAGMLTSQRKKLILTRLVADGQIVARDLALELGTSEDTIRRDLRELARGGKLQRVHGGALPASAAVGDLQIREQVSPKDKIELGRIGASMIQPNQVVILDGGTTALQVARQLAPNLRATIVTHSPTVAVEAAKHQYVDIIMLGGRLFRHSMVNVGAAVIDAASRLRADIYFMGVTGVHPDAGLSTGDAEEAAVKRVLHERAAETVVLASAEKLMAASPFLVAAFAEFSLLVVPAKTPDRVVRALRTGGVKIERASARC